MFPYLTTEDWTEFDKRFPDAEHFLVGRNLWREYENLKTEVKAREAAIVAGNWIDTKRHAWVKSRFQELANHFQDVLDQAVVKLGEWADNHHKSLPSP